MAEHQALLTNDAVVLGLLAVILGLVFQTSHSAHPFWKRFYGIVPALLLCYFIPAVFNTLGVIDGHVSGLYPMARDYLLPSALILLTLSIDLKAIMRLGPKAGIMFLTGTLGVVIGGPIALLVVGSFWPELFGAEGPEAVWRGMTTMAGSWIGGGANQAAMKEVYEAGPDIFGKFVAVDVIVANIWMAVILFMAGRAERIDRWLKADTSAIEDLKQRVEKEQAAIARLPSLTDLITIAAIALGFTGLSHFLADIIAPWLATNAPYLAQFSLTSKFFWLVVLATTFGFAASFTRLRHFEGAGASKIGQVMIYVLVATIGMHMDLRAMKDAPVLFLLGLVWISVHAILMLGMARLIRAPLFYMAVGSQANIGGAASAPVVASAFHPALAPVGVLLAVFGYAVGTYGGWLCGQLLRVIVGG